MVKGLYTAYTGMINEQKRLDVVANNLANADTTGYKKEGATSAAFEDQLAIRIKDSGTNFLPRRLGTVNMGVKIGETYTNYDQGSFEVTDNNSDIAIAGNGFFAIEFTDKQGNTSIKYTRDGNFTVDREGYLVTADGNHVLNMNAALTSAQGEAGYVRVDPLAEMSVDQTGQIYQNGQVIDRIGYVDVADYNYLSKYGENLYDLEDGGQIIASDAQIEQGCLEASNVNVVDEMVSMITIQRAYEAGQKMIQTEDDTLEMAVNQVGNV